jgi:hypothetical protein
VWTPDEHIQLRELIVPYFPERIVGVLRSGTPAIFAAFIVCTSVGLSTAPATAQQLNQNCVVGVLNRTTLVNADGSWILPNVPANFGLVRARATCVQNGITIFGQSNLFALGANGTVNLPHIQLGNTSPIPASIAITAPTTSLTQVGANAQLTATATYAGGTTQNITAGSTGTQYNVSNPAIATVGVNGLVTAVSSGTALIQVVNEGTQGILTIQVVLGGVSHGGIPDSWAIANGLDPTDPALPFEDPDHDGLTNLQEFQLGTDPNNPDTDGDGLTDGQEVLIYHTNPLLASTDGTGIPDGIEVQTGTLGGSFSAKLAAAMKSLEVKPSTFALAVNLIEGQASQQLTVLGHLSDGKTIIDLTSTQKGTNYSSSDLTICNFGAPDGNVFAGSPGSCTITVTNSGFVATAAVTVTGFSPKSLSFIGIPGFANGVAVNGNFAYIAAGSAGLQVVDVTDRSNPHIAGSLSLPGNANDVRLLGGVAYIAAGSAGLLVVDVTNPLAPLLRGSLGTGGNALHVAVRGSTAYIANGSNLFLANVSNPAAMTQIVALPLTGTIQGVDVDAQRKLAVVAAGSAGIYVVDISNQGAPVLRGSASTGDARAVAIGGNFAFVADYLNSTTSVDITTPSAPVVRSHIADPNLGGFLLDVVLSGNFALGADVKFVNGIPITDITDPTQLQARAILNFPQRDDNGMGIAADGSFVYLTTEHSNLSKFGSSGDSRLYIGQYRALQDLKGIPPVASIISPVAGSTVIQGAKLPIVVNATDDVAVAGVNFLVNGQVVFTATTLPYQFSFSVPTNVSSLTLGATAVDLGGNVGTAQNVVVNVIPDPLTAVIGRVVDINATPVAGANVTFGNLTTTSAADGTFSLPGVPTAQGNIIVLASAVIGGRTLRGKSVAASPVPSGTTNVGDIALRSSGIIGYYDLSLNQGSSTQVAPINTAGLQPVNVGDLRTADLSQFDVLFVQNPDNSGFSSIFTSNLAKVQQFIANGGVFILHDRNVSSAASVLPGSPGTIVRDFSDGANIDIVDNTTLVTNGPGGFLTNTSLDGGNFSSHGWILASSIPAGARGILSQTNPAHLVLYSYPFGFGKVIYSTIPLDFYLASFGNGTVNTNMQKYAANVVAYGNSLR